MSSSESINVAAQAKRAATEVYSTPSKGPLLRPEVHRAIAIPYSTTRPQNEWRAQDLQIKGHWISYTEQW